MSGGMGGLLSSGRGGSGRAAVDEPLWLEWLTLGGLLAFATWLLGARGVWHLLLTSDPTGLTLVILVVFVAATLWCGSRSRELQRQRRLMLAAARQARHGDPGDDGWAGAYWAALAASPRDSGAPLDLLLDQAQGPHHTAWWVNGIQLKLGLLGKVIGFSMLAIQIGQMQSFDAAQSQDLLRSLTSGLGVALLTTMVGLVGNILLGLQLTRLDRYADALVSDCQRLGLAIGASRQGD
ncbi:MotA/TolQ/ExbB proton channel family protein [Sphaerotilus hippei]|uniref:MotA/TolQ/ExbB proton channel family protein n=1 Tax=Sphaerotilus hippei TaxID=744406 RepID=A0A318H4Y9_9BURK|nr:MotA/TolQ/ExbB proton channel family protein [Sphaerotilus hippei]PXW98803.1 MotA/TolQ/ExbB proton channel family protein [Sphaerotilus hippei]